MHLVKNQNVIFPDKIVKSQKGFFHHNPFLDSPTNFQKKNSKETELFNYIWQPKEKNQHFNISWSIVKREAPYQSGPNPMYIAFGRKILDFESG